MRFNALLIAGAVALANAQETNSPSGSVPSVPTPTGVDPAASSAAAKINKCLESCDVTDVTCQASCVAVPAPNESQAIATDQCVRKCDQGKGTEADTEAFSQCVQKCVSNHYYSAGNGTPQPTGGARGGGSNNGDNSASGSEAPTGSGTGAGSNGSGTSTRSGSSSEATESGNGEDGDGNAAPRVGGSLVAGLFGLVAAFFM